MTRRDRVMRALNFEETDRVPLDLGGMLSTGISCFAYPALAGALDLPPRAPKIHDTFQMLALPDPDVLDALGCDVVCLFPDLTNAFDEPEKWRPYDFNGRLPALVRDPAAYEVRPDGTIMQPASGYSMPPGAHVFEAEHGGQPFSLEGALTRPDLDEVARTLAAQRLTNARIADIAAYARRARAATDRAILFNGPGAGIGIGAFSGIAIFPTLCMTEPEFVRELHECVISHAVAELERLLPAIADCIDVYLVSADDWGTQNNLIASPQTYEELFLPYYRRVNDTIHRLAPGVKTFLHCCGAVYSLIDAFVESGFDVLNPVQWTAGGHTPEAWKAKAHGRIALWGGGVNAQATLPLGTVEDVAREVAEVVPVLARGGGYVFNSIHNILAEIPPEKIIAMYRAAGSL